MFMHSVSTVSLWAIGSVPWSSTKASDRLYPMLSGEQRTKCAIVNPDKILRKFLIIIRVIFVCEITSRKQVEQVMSFRLRYALSRTAVSILSIQII